MPGRARRKAAKGTALMESKKRATVPPCSEVRQTALGWDGEQWPALSCLGLRRTEKRRGRWERPAGRPDTLPSPAPQAPGWWANGQCQAGKQDPLEPPRPSAAVALPEARHPLLWDLTSAAACRTCTPLAQPQFPQMPSLPCLAGHTLPPRAWSEPGCKGATRSPPAKLPKEAGGDGPA